VAVTQSAEDTVGLLNQDTVVEVESKLFIKTWTVYLKRHITNQESRKPNNMLVIQAICTR